MRRLVTTAVLALALAGCSSAGPSTSPSVSMPTPAPTVPSASPSSSAVAVAPDPCERLTNAEVGKAFDTKVSQGTPASQDGSKLCTYSSGTSGLRISALATPMVEDLDKLTPYITDQIKDAKITTVTIEGAEDARLVTGTIEGVPAVDVIAARKGVMFQVFTTQTKGDSKKLSSQASAAMVALLG